MDRHAAEAYQAFMQARNVENDANNGYSNDYDAYIAIARNRMVPPLPTLHPPLNTPPMNPPPTNHQLIAPSAAYHEALTAQFWQISQQMQDLNNRVRQLEEENQLLKSVIETVDYKTNALEDFIAQEILPHTSQGRALAVARAYEQQVQLQQHHQQQQQPEETAPSTRSRAMGRPCSGANCESFMDIDTSMISGMPTASIMLNTPRDSLLRASILSRAAEKENKLDIKKTRKSDNTTQNLTASSKGKNNSKNKSKVDREISSSASSSFSSVNTSSSEDTSSSEGGETSDDNSSEVTPHASPSKARRTHNPAANNTKKYELTKALEVGHKNFIMLVRAQNFKIKTENRTNYNINPDCTLYALLKVRSGKVVEGFPATIAELMKMKEEKVDQVVHEIGLIMDEATLAQKLKKLLNATVAGLS